MQIGKEYIAFSTNEGMILLHQRRAHKRILFEYFSTVLANNKGQSQKLLLPKEIKLNKQDVEIEPTSINFLVGNVISMKIIKDAVPQCTILQYGLRGQASKAIMEFALDITDNEKSTAVKTITSQLEQHDMNIRRISS